jgi:UDP-N-acetylglucosamine 2-epimerase (non-hydrolysing)
MNGRLHLVTERPETVAVGSNVLAGTDPVKIVECTSIMIQTFEKFDQNAALKWANPFGDGTAGERIVQLLKER